MRGRPVGIGETRRDRANAPAMPGREPNVIRLGLCLFRTSVPISKFATIAACS